MGVRLLNACVYISARLICASLKIYMYINYIKIIPKDLHPLPGPRLGVVSGWVQTQLLGGCFIDFLLLGAA